MAPKRALPPRQPAAPVSVPAQGGNPYMRAFALNLVRGIAYSTGTALVGGALWWLQQR